MDRTYRRATRRSDAPSSGWGDRSFVQKRLVGRGAGPSVRKRPVGVIVLTVICVALIIGLGIGAVSLARAVAGRRGSAGGASDRQGVEVRDEADDGLADDGTIVMTPCGSHETIVRTGEEYVEPGCLARDTSASMSLSDRVQTSGEVDTSTPGVYTVTYTVENDEGARAKAERTVRVVDDVDGGWDEDGISVMMYHYVYDPADPPESVDGNYVTTDELEEQLAWLSDRGFYQPSWAELRAFIDGTHSLPDKSIVLTFDDGEYGFLNLGIPLLEKYGIAATSFTECSRDDIDHMLDTYASPYICFESHSYDMHHAGSTPIGHGGAIYDLSEDELVDDLQHAVDILGTRGAFAYPYGDVSDVSAAAIERVGILCSFTTEYEMVYVGSDPTRLPRIRVTGGEGLEFFQGSAW